MYENLVCRKCNLWKQSKHIVPSEPSQKDLYVLLNPLTIALPSVTKLEQTLAQVEVAQWLKQAGIPPDRVYFSSLLKCSVSKTTDDKSLNDAKVACSDYVFDELNIVQPKVILAIGKDSFEFLGGKPGEFIKNIGEPFITNDTTIIPIFSPSFIAHPDNKNHAKRIPQIMAQVNLALNGGKEAIEYDYKIVKTYPEFEEFFNEIMKQPKWSFDTEGTGLDIYKNELMGIGFSWRRRQGVYVPIREYMPILGVQETWGSLQQVVIDKVKLILQSDAIKMAHNGKYDTKVCFHEFGEPVKEVIVDTMLLLSVTKSNLEKFGLDAVSDMYADLTGYKDDTARYGNELYRAPTEKLGARNNGDTDITYRIYEDNITELEEDPKFKFLFEEMLMPLSDLTSRMEYTGIRIDKDASLQLHKDLFAELKVIDDRITKVVGKKLNVRSPDQMGEFIYGKLKIPYDVKNRLFEISKTGKYPSTGKNQLKELLKTSKNPVLKDIVDYRSLASSKTVFDSFVPKILRLDNKDKDFLLDKNDYFHGNYKLHSATGRLRAGKDEDDDDGSNSIQLQNIPRVKRFRRPFLPDYNHLMFGYDYAQIELRILAHVTQDPKLLEACRMNYDLHSFVGGMMANLPYEEVLAGVKAGNQKYIDIRNLSKNIGFGWVYGAQDGKFAIYFPGRTLAEQTVNEKKSKQSYFERFSRILPTKHAIIEEGRKNGFVRTLSGRRIYCPDINATNYGAKSHAERQLMNAMIQGPASDYNHLGAIYVDKYITEHNLDARAINFIHDAGYFSINPSIIREHVPEFVKILESSKFGVTAKMKVDYKISDYWEGKDRTTEFMEAA